MSENACEKIALFCVGSTLMLDDGLGPAVYEQLNASYAFPENVHLFDVGCLSLDMISYVDAFDVIITIDALDGTDAEPGTVFTFAPDDMARRGHAMQSLHELKLMDLFDAASLLGSSCEGVCFGIQVENRSPEVVTIGLTKAVYDAVPLLIDAVLAELVSRGVEIVKKEDGQRIMPGHHHVWIDSAENEALS